MRNGAASWVTEAVGDLVQILDSANVTRTHLVGHDWGAAVAWFRAFTRGDGDLEQNIADLSRPGALTASLNWYRANLAPRMPGRRPDLPLVQVPTLGVWSTRDHYLDGERMGGSGAFVAGPWRYEQIEDASHWLQLDAPASVNRLLLEWLRR